MSSNAIVTVGRGEHVDIFIDDDTVSTEHMTMQIIGDKIDICDCNSTNGVFIKNIGKKKIIHQLVTADTELLLGNYCTTPRKLIDLYNQNLKKPPVQKEEKQETEPFSRYLRSDNGTFDRR